MKNNTEELQSAQSLLSVAATAFSSVLSDRIKNSTEHIEPPLRLALSDVNAQNMFPGKDILFSIPNELFDKVKKLAFDTEQLESDIVLNAIHYHRRLFTEDESLMNYSKSDIKHLSHDSEIETLVIINFQETDIEYIEWASELLTQEFEVTILQAIDIWTIKYPSSQRYIDRVAGRLEKNL